MTVYTATKTALKVAAEELDIDVNPDTVVYRGGQDPGGVEPGRIIYAPWHKCVTGDTEQQ